MVAINNGSVANLYISNPEGTKYSLSLENILFYKKSDGKRRYGNVIIVLLQYFVLDFVQKLVRECDLILLEHPCSFNVFSYYLYQESITRWHT